MPYKRALKSIRNGRTKKMPDTFAYFIAGYIVIFGLLLGYVGYLFSQRKKIDRLRKELTQEQKKV